MSKKEIIDAWATIRKQNNTIPDDVLDFMKDAAIEKINKVMAYKKSRNINELKKQIDSYYFFFGSF